VNQSPEARLLTRYAVTIVFAALAFVIGPRAFAEGIYGFVLLGAAVIGTRLVYATPPRFALRNASPRLRAVWYVLLIEVIAAATAFVLAFDKRGSFAGSLVALAVVVALEIVATRTQHAEFVRAGVIIEPAPEASSADLEPFTGEADGPANQALKNALSDVLAEVPTVVRAYLVLSAHQDGSDRRVLALRFAYPWIDEDGIRAAHHVFQDMAPAGDTLTVIGLDDRLEARVRAVASAFYERTSQTPAAD
jgi:hypothetical protein